MNDPHAMIGTILAERFLIERSAGHGGMGTVYRARDLMRGLPVAIKLMHKSRASELNSQRFVREAKLLEELQHPGIVSYVTHDYTRDGAPFLAMEWLDGEDLAQRLRGKGLSLHETLTLLQKISAALAVAHQKGIIHRVPNKSTSPTGKLVKFSRNNCAVTATKSVT